MIRRQHGGEQGLEQQHVLSRCAVYTSGSLVVLRASQGAPDEMEMDVRWTRGCRAHSPGPCREILNFTASGRQYDLAALFEAAILINAIENSCYVRLKRVQ